MDYEQAMYASSSNYDHQQNCLTNMNVQGDQLENDNEPIPFDWNVLMDYKDPYSALEDVPERKDRSPQRNLHLNVATTLKEGESHLESYLRSVGKLKPSSSSRVRPAMISARPITKTAAMTNTIAEPRYNFRGWSNDCDDDSLQSLDINDLSDVDDWRTAFGSHRNGSDDDEPYCDDSYDDCNERLNRSISSTGTLTSLSEAMAKLNRCMEQSSMTRSALTMHPSKAMFNVERNHSSCPDLDVKLPKNFATNRPSMYSGDNQDGRDSSQSLYSVGANPTSQSIPSRFYKNGDVRSATDILGAGGPGLEQRKQLKSKKTHKYTVKVKSPKGRHMACSGLVSNRVNSKRNLLSLQPLDGSTSSIPSSYSNGSLKTASPSMRSPVGRNSKKSLSMHKLLLQQKKTKDRQLHLQLSSLPISATQGNKNWTLKQAVPPPPPMRNSTSIVSVGSDEDFKSRSTGATFVNSSFSAPSLTTYERASDILAQALDVVGDDIVGGNGFDLNF